VQRAALEAAPCVSYRVCEARAELTGREEARDAALNRRGTLRAREERLHRDGAGNGVGDRRRFRRGIGVDERTAPACRHERERQVERRRDEDGRTANDVRGRELAVAVSVRHDRNLFATADSSDERRIVRLDRRSDRDGGNKDRNGRKASGGEHETSHLFSPSIRLPQ